ncbi:MAG: LacI family DNA-binding transcriptional regulator [Truepera sp.]|nr:LacI family DNA-binding transcriptional regulator [Truepera sp.]
MRKVTLQDLASRLGVSRSTVSRALRSDPQIGAATQAKVQQLARDLNYRPNAAAQALIRRQAGAVGLLLPRSPEFVFANPYFNELLAGVAAVAEAAGYALLVSATPHPNYERWLREGRVDGLMVLGGSIRSEDAPLLNHLVEAGYPLLLIHAASVALRAITVGSDEQAGIYQALAHLAALGHRRVAFFTGPRETLYAARREQAYWQGVEALGLERDTALRRFGKDTMESGRELLRELLDRDIPVTAVLTNNDLMAFGVLAELQERGRRVPEDLSVVGFDDIMPAALLGLTTVRQPVQELGAKAMETLIRLMRHESAKSLVLDTSLVVRRSTGPVR